MDVSVYVVVGRDSVENEVEAASVLLHLVRMLRNDDLVRAEAESVILLIWRSREDYNVRSERMGNLSAHMTEPTETDHANLLALADAPVAHGRVSRDSSAKQGSGSGEVKVRGDAESEPLVDHDAVGVAAVGEPPRCLDRKSVV